MKNKHHLKVLLRLVGGESLNARRSRVPKSYWGDRVVFQFSETERSIRDETINVMVRNGLLVVSKSGVKLTDLGRKSAEEHLDETPCHNP